METSKRIAAVRARLRDIQIVERMAEDVGPPCTACIFGPIKKEKNGVGLCDHVAHWEKRHDPVSGKWKASLNVTTVEARSPEGLCGPEGLLFQPYRFPRNIAKWLADPNHAFALPLFIVVVLSLLGAAIITVQGRW